jgi:cytoskeletal protein RodZ
MALAALLRETRQSRGLTLEQLAHETKIGVDRLSAFERDDLPPDGSFYARARLRAYAQALGLDHRTVLEQLNQEVLAAAPLVVTEPPAPLAHRVNMPRVALPVACVVLIVLIVSVWFKPSPSLARAASRVRPASNSALTPSATRPVVDRAVPALAPAVLAPVAVTTAMIVEPGPVSAGTSGVLAQPVLTLPVVTPPVVTPPVATSLVITSTPDGASVTVDGIGWGTTPVTIRHLPEGHKRIRVTSDGYASVERVFDVQSDLVNRLALQLEPVKPDGEPTP